MSSVVLKKGIEEPWAWERVARFINSLGVQRDHVGKRHRAGNNRVQKCCSWDLQRRGHARGCGPRRQAYERICRERSDVVARCHQNHQVPCEELHTRRTPRRLPDFAVVGGTCGEHFVQVPEGLRWSDAIRKIAWQGAYTRVCAIRREGAGETNVLRTVEENESQIQVRSVAE